MKTSLSSTNDWLRSFIHLVYPNTCAGCGHALPTSKYAVFCSRCHAHVLTTRHHLIDENDFTTRFWGRLPLNAGMSLYYFSKKGPLQHALHRLKYGNQPEIGLKFGRHLGRLMANHPLMSDLEGIAPVPLHPKKLQQRGYNQSFVFAQGIAEAMGLPVMSDLLTRATHGESQTRKHRVERFENVDSVFVVRHQPKKTTPHLLLVDDVLTTGATLETCAQKLLEVAPFKLSMATIAIALQQDAPPAA